MTERGTRELLDSVQKAAREMILSHLRKDAVSLSSQQRKRTGNAYQAIRLGNDIVPGFRSGARHIFAGVPLQGKTVLDLGCNLGEITRDARRAGAARAYGIDYDPFFVQMARYIAAYNQMAGVSFHQGDLTDPRLYAGSYDVVVALSVFTYITKFLDRIAAMTKDLLIVETHAATEDWRRLYLDRLRKHFPYVALVGVSDQQAWGCAESRYVLFGAHRPLDELLFARARAMSPLAGLPAVDLKKSTIRHYDGFLATIGVERFAAFGEVVAAAVRHLEGTPAEALFDEVKTKGVVQSALYWCHFLKGYSEYAACGAMVSDNTYYVALMQLLARGLYDGGLRSLIEGADGGRPQLARRYEVFQALSERADGSTLDPLIAFQIISGEHFGARGHGYKLHLNEIDEIVHPLALDGHHRLFAAYMTGATGVRILPIWYEEAVRAFVNKDPANKDVIWEYVHKFVTTLRSATVQRQPQRLGRTG